MVLRQLLSVVVLVMLALPLALVAYFNVPAKMLASAGVAGGRRPSSIVTVNQG
jgi:hypothetical protein